MASNSDDDLVHILCTAPNFAEAKSMDQETVISAVDVDHWDSPMLLNYRRVRLLMHRNMLMKESSYFRGLLSGSFRESSLDCISIQWNLETIIGVMKSIHGYPVDIGSHNFFPLLEGALYFGVEPLLLKCRTWFSEVSSSKVPSNPGLLLLQLDDLICIWNFGLEHAIDYIPEFCASYLARSFMLAMSSSSFVNIPHSLLMLCLKHSDLTIKSEMHLCDSILLWLEANTKQLESQSPNKVFSVDLLEHVRIGLLPLWFVGGKRNSVYFSELANKSIHSIVKLMNIQIKSSINSLYDDDFNHQRIRFTEFLEKVDLSGCPQLSSDILHLALLPSSYSVDSVLMKHIREQFLKCDGPYSEQWKLSIGLPPILSFGGVKEVDISKCPRLKLEAFIEYFSLSFPSLTTLKAAYLLNVKAITLQKLMNKCPQINEVDLTLDSSPLRSAQVSVLSSSLAILPPVSTRYSVFQLERPSNITKLTLEGWSDIFDTDLLYMSEFLVSLQYLNLNGCTSLTDRSISNLLQRCAKLSSILVCETAFGINSVLAQCSPNYSLGSSSTASLGKGIGSLACNLLTLHLGGCRGVDEYSLIKLISQTQQLESLCLRDTHLVDDAIYIISSSSLVALDVSNTMISGAALGRVIQRNPNLKYLNARGCRNLTQVESSQMGFEVSASKLSNQLQIVLGKACRLEELSFGWGFSVLSLENLKPAIMSLRTMTVGVGGSLSEDALRSLSIACPMLESVVLYFQVISDCVVSIILEDLRHLQVFALYYCFGDISISSFKFFTKKLRKLKLERVTPWMTNDDLEILTQNFPNLVELSLRGCSLLNSDCQSLISNGWPGLISLHLEDCGGVTARGVSSLFDCVGLEDVVLRHNGPGLKRNFILDAASKMPMLRKLSLDMCDSSQGDFDIPNFEDRCYLTTVKLARCKRSKCSFQLQRGDVGSSSGMLVHKETLVLSWNSTNLVRTVIKERL